jgi:hypothetical protein
MDQFSGSRPDEQEEEDEEEVDDDEAFDDDDEEGDEGDDEVEEEVVYDPAIEADKIALFEKTQLQIKTFFDEVSILSKKKPDAPLNKFKIGILNHSIVNANCFLKDDYRPFPGFDQFDSDALPTASDVAMMLAQYLKSLATFKSDCTHRNYDHKMYWNVQGHPAEYKCE